MTLNVDEAMAVIRQTRRLAGQADRFFDDLSALPPAELAHMVEPALRFREKLEFAVEELTAALKEAQRKVAS
jgi:hypothetical protein